MNEADQRARSAWREVAASAGADAANRTIRGARPDASFLTNLPQAVLADASGPSETGSPVAPTAAVGLGRTTLRATLPPPPAETASHASTAGHEHFELLERIGEGGMGVVYRARQKSLGRDVALKRLREGDASAAGRFVVEGRVTAWLEHPSIVPIHLLCRGTDGAPYLAMKLVRGREWVSMLDDPGVPLQRHVDVLVSVCNAIGFAHANGVVHRDLKPENIMVGEYGEVYVLDWGVAFAADARASAATGLPRPQEFEPLVGTPSYMAPEQALGRGADHGPLIDVFQLGCCLHTILVGTPRHLGKDVEAVLTEAALASPYAYPSRVPPELADIANRAAAASPDDRFPSALALRNALQGWLLQIQAEVFVRDGDAALAEVFPHETAEEAADATARRRLREGRAAYEAALRIAPKHAGAIEGRELLLQEQVRVAIRLGDLAEATTLADELNDPAVRAAVDDAVRAANERAEELERLRDERRRRDWRNIAIPQSEIGFVAASLTLFVGLAITWLTDDWTDPREQGWVALWLIPVLGLPLVAEWRMRRGPDINTSQSLALHLQLAPAPTVAAIIVGLRWWQGELLWPVVPYLCFISAVVAFGLAVQWQRWLIGPAVIFVVTGITASLAGPWLMAVIGVGSALALAWAAVMMRLGAARR